MLESRLGLRMVFRCKVDKIFLRAPLVFMERRAPLVHGRLRATPLATNCWPEAPRGGGGGAGVVGVLGPAEPPPPPGWRRLVVPRGCP